MPRLRMLTIMAGPECYHDLGSVVETSDEAAAELIAGGYAEAVDVAEAAEATPVAEDAALANRPSKKKKS